MTWEAFKEAVEAAGVRDEDQIESIDTGSFPEAEQFNVVINDAKEPRRFTVSA